MKKSILVSAIAAVMMSVVATSCQHIGSVKIETANDSLSYAAGVVQSNGLLPFLSEAFGVDSTQTEQVIKGIQKVVNTASEKDAAYLLGISIGTQLHDQVIQSLNFRMFRGDSLNKVDGDAFVSYFVRASQKDPELMNTFDAQLYVTTQSRAIHLDSLEVTPQICDSLAMAFGVMQAEGFVDQFLVGTKQYDEATIEKVYEGVLAVNKIDANEKPYYVGIHIGQQMEDQVIPYMQAELFVTSELNRDAFYDAFFVALLGKDLLMDVNEAGAYIRQEGEKRHEQQMEIEFGENRLAGVAFLENNKTQEGVQVTASGLQYKVLKAGKGAQPTATSKVKVHYHGTTIDGTVFDSSVERGTPSEFGLNQVIAGWTEGLQLMQKGAKYQFFIPYELAYGSRQMGEIKPFSTLIFEVELLDIVE